MIKKQFKEFIKLLGMDNEEITDETLDYLVEQMQKILEFDNVQNSISFKTGCLLHQLVLKNQKEIRESLEDQVRNKNFTEPLPKFQFFWHRICLNLEEDYSCSVLKKMNAEQIKCQFVNQQYIDCEIVQKSVSVMENWT